MTSAHAAFEASDAVQRYVLGQMTDAESARFEEHFLDCTACLERLEVERRLREGLRAGATGVPATLEAPPARAKPARTPWVRLQPALAAGLALAVSALLLRELWHTRRELDGLRRQAGAAGSEGWQAERARWQALLEQERARAVQQQQDAERARAALEAALAQAREPAARTLVLSLESERAGDPSTAPASLSLPAEPALVVLALSSEAAGVPVAVTLRSGTRLVWQGRVQAQPDGSVWLALPSAWLPAGRYQLRLGSPGAGRSGVQDYAFVVSVGVR